MMGRIVRLSDIWRVDGEETSKNADGDSFPLFELPAGAKLTLLDSDGTATKRFKIEHPNEKTRVVKVSFDYNLNPVVTFEESEAG